MVVCTFIWRDVTFSFDMSKFLAMQVLCLRSHGVIVYQSDSKTWRFDLDEYYKDFSRLCDFDEGQEYGTSSIIQPFHCLASMFNQT